MSDVDPREPFTTDLLADRLDVVDAESNYEEMLKRRPTEDPPYWRGGRVGRNQDSPSW